MSKNADKPVSPVHGVPNFTGLTKRELIAAMAMQGLVERDNYSKIERDAGRPQGDALRHARTAVRYADALLAELERRDD